MAEDNAGSPRKWDEPEEKIRTLEEFVWVASYAVEDPDTDFDYFRTEYERYLEECGFWD